jgi:hypothetical protein
MNGLVYGRWIKHRTDTKYTKAMKGRMANKAKKSQGPSDGGWDGRCLILGCDSILFLSSSVPNPSRLFGLVSG